MNTCEVSPPPEPFLRSDKGWIAGLLVFLSGYMVYLLFLSAVPAQYSYEEMSRAEATCHGMISPCFGDELRRWRKENPDAPRGSWP